MKKEIPVFFSTDDNYIPYLDVAISSLIANASEDFRYRIIVRVILCRHAIQLVCHNCSSRRHILQNFGRKTVSCENLIFSWIDQDARFFLHGNHFLVGSHSHYFHIGVICSKILHYLHAVSVSIQHQFPIRRVYANKTLHQIYYTISCTNASTLAACATLFFSFKTNSLASIPKLWSVCAS